MVYSLLYDIFTAVFQPSLFEIIFLIVLLIADLSVSIWFAWSVYWEDLKSFWDSVLHGVFAFIFLPIYLCIPLIIIGLVLHYVFGIDPVFEFAGYSFP